MRRKRCYSCELHPGQPSYLIKNGRNFECKTDNHIPLVVPGVQAAVHQTRALGDRRQTRAVGDHERQAEIDLPEWLQPFTKGLTVESSSSTDVSQADVEMPPPAPPPSAHPPAKQASNESTEKAQFIHSFSGRTELRSMQTHGSYESAL